MVWDGAPDARVDAAKLKPITAVLEVTPLPAPLRRFIDWVAAYTLAFPGDVLAMALRVNALTAETPAPGWRLAGLAGGRMTEARARVAAVLADGRPRATGGAGALGRRGHRDRPRHGAGRAARAGGAAGRAPPFDRPDPAHPGPTLSPEQDAAGGALREAVAARSVLGDAAGRRHRVGQDRGVFRGGGRLRGAGAAGAGAAAGDRAVLAMAGAVCRAVRRGAGGVAFRPAVALAPGHVAGGGGGRGAGGGGRAVGVVPAVSGSRPRGDRRGARDGVQAGGGRGVSRPRHGGGAGAAVGRAGGAGVGDAEPGDAGQCRGGPLPADHAGGAAWRGGVARGRGDRSARCAAGARAVPVAGADRGGARDDRARRAGDVVPQPPRLRAADAVPALRAPDAVPELHGLAGRAPGAAGADLPPLRPHRADPADLPELRGRAQPGADRARRGADHRGGGRRCSPRRGAW